MTISYDNKIRLPIWLLFIFCKVTMIVGPIQMKTLKSLKSTELGDHFYNIISSMIQSNRMKYIYFQSE